MADISNYGYPQTSQTCRARRSTKRAHHGVGVQQSLCRMLMPTVSGVNNACVSPLAQLPRNTTCFMAYHECSNAHGAHGFNSVAQAFAFIDT